jgi:thiamine biosynthesis lipoprotein
MGAALKLFQFPFKAMGSPCEIKLYATDLLAAGRVASLARADVERLEARYSRFRPESLLSQINRVAAAGGSIDVDEETAGLFNYADACFRESGGLFDVTSGLLRQAWRFDQAALPAPELISSLLDRIGWQKVRWESPRIGFPAGMELDFGGIVKEYAVDRLVTLCREAGCQHGIVNLGGDIRVIGPHADGQPWRVGIQDPRQPGANPIATLSLLQGGVATSGDYERCIIVAGVRYGHVLNPRTGWPVRHLASVTVVADFCVVAGSASTIAMLKERKGGAWLDQLGLQNLWIDTEGRSGGPLAANRQPRRLP